MLHASLKIGVRPVVRSLLILGVIAFAQAAPAVAFAQAGASALPSLASDAQTQSGLTGQGQAAYPSLSAPASASPLEITGLKPAQAAQPAPSAQPTSVAATPAAPAPSAPPSVLAPAGSVSPQATGSDIQIPTPPPPSAFSNNDANQLAVQAEQAAMQAQAQADLAAQKHEQEHNVKSYDKASSGLMPLSTDQIRDFMHKLEQTQNAAQFPYEGNPKGQTRIATLSLDPGVEPPQVNLATGYVTTITMVDATGEPWPILDVGVGGNFEVSPTQAGSHVVRIMPLTRVGVGDLSVLLKDLPTPVIFRLSAGGPVVDLRYDARIGKMGPGARVPIISRPRLEAGDETMTLILENAPPNSATRLKIGGLDERTKAWSVGEKTYIRTPLSLLSPAWNSSVASADGTNVYEIGNAPVLLMSDNGAMIRAHLSRDEDHDK